MTSNNILEMFDAADSYKPIHELIGDGKILPVKVVKANGSDGPKVYVALTLEVTSGEFQGEELDAGAFFSSKPGQGSKDYNRRCMGKLTALGFDREFFAQAAANGSGFETAAKSAVGKNFVLKTKWQKQSAADKAADKPVYDDHTWLPAGYTEDSAPASAVPAPSSAGIAGFD